MNRRIVGSLAAALAVAASASGTTLFSSPDIHRPLVPRQIPDKAVFLQLFPAGVAKAVRRGHKKVRRARSAFDVTKVDDRTLWIGVSRLHQAMELNPADPFAPCLLGAYFALHHELAAAVDATEESLRLLQAIEGKPVEGSPLTDLHLRCGINLARYRLLLGDAEGALDELAELPPLELAQSSLVRKAFWWVSALALIDVGDTRTGRRALAEAMSIDTLADLKAAGAWSDLSAESYDYPQYFQWAGVVEQYLDALLLWEEGRQSEAIETLYPAVERWRKFYDARLALGIFLLDTGRLDDGLRVLEELRDARVQGKVMRPEAITYNLAIAQERRGETGEAAALYQDALRQAEERDCRYFKKLVAYVPEARTCPLAATCEALVRSGCRLPRCKDPENEEELKADRSPVPGYTSWLCESLRREPFAAAHNNLGLLYLQRAEGNGSGKGASAGQGKDWFAEAITQFKVVLAGVEPDSLLWHQANLNLADAYRAQSEPESLLARLNDGLSRPSAPIQAYVSRLEVTDSASARWQPVTRLYLDVAESFWGQEPPRQVRTHLTMLVRAFAAEDSDPEVDILAARARRLLGEDGTPDTTPLSPLAAATEELRDGLVRGHSLKTLQAISSIAAACPGLPTGNPCPDAPIETARDAAFLEGRWYLNRGDKDQALLYFEAATDLDPAWPVSRRYLDEIRASEPKR